jgi:hypothetical protein
MEHSTRRNKRRAEVARQWRPVLAPRPVGQSGHAGPRPFQRALGALRPGEPSGMWTSWGSRPVCSAGRPSLPDGLAAGVHPGGRLLATDLETRWIADRIDPRVEVARHDVVHGDPPEGGDSAAARCNAAMPTNAASSDRHRRRRHSPVRGRLAYGDAAQRHGWGLTRLVEKQDPAVHTAGAPWRAAPGPGAASSVEGVRPRFVNNGQGDADAIERTHADELMGSPTTSRPVGQPHEVPSRSGSPLNSRVLGVERSALACIFPGQHSVQRFGPHNPWVVGSSPTRPTVGNVLVRLMLDAGASGDG